MPCSASAARLGHVLQLVGLRRPDPDLRAPVPGARRARARGPRHLAGARRAGSWRPSSGELYWSLELDETPPFPSPADALYLLYYPASYVALVLHRPQPRAALPAQPVARRPGGRPHRGRHRNGLRPAARDRCHRRQRGPVATTLAYPLADILLLAFVLALLTLTGWRMRPAHAPRRRLRGRRRGRRHLRRPGPKETYVEGTILDAIWPLGTLLLAAAALAAPATAQRAAPISRAGACSPCPAVRGRRARPSRLRRQHGHWA